MHLGRHQEEVGDSELSIKYASVVAGLLLMTAAAEPAAAHHSFAAEFDINRPIELTGTVTKMEFSNPHTWLHVRVVTKDGKTEDWAFEGGAPNALVRRGWGRNSLPAGTKVKVEGYQARDGSFRGSGRTVTYVDTGKKLFMGSAGRGAPSKKK